MGQRVRRLLRARAYLRLCAAAVLLAVPAHAWGARATLAADAHVNSALPAVNSGAISNLNVGGGYTALLQFDLSMLPAGTIAAKVSHAVLTLYVNRVNTAGVIAVAPATVAWGEYSVTYATEPSVGGSIGQFTVGQAGAFVAIDVTAQVQSWIASPATNVGFALTAASANVQFDSKENDQTAHAATLDIELIDAGAAGATGAPGAIGPAGAKGSAGAIGPLGPVGSTGPQGPVGATGATGPPGTSVAAGAGALVYQGAYSSIQNYALGDVVTWQGSSYTSLLASNHGNTPSFSPQQWGVLSAQGPAGTTGGSGSTGAAGPQGLPGNVGPNGPVGAQGLQGSAGQAGAQGIPGTTGVTGLSGPMGPQGVPGPVGITFQGAYASTSNYALADGVSYQGSGYVSLVASNHGNTPDQSPQWALFALAGAAGATGPAGLTGATGATGPAGVRGPMGVTGSTGATGPQGPPVANYLGNYQSVVNYALHDAVSWQGSTYVSLIAGNNGNTPDQSLQQWAVLAAQGLQGAVGVNGVVGAMGPAGLVGVSGPAGIQGPPVTFRGGWLTGTVYATGEAVAYGGSGYIALSANAGREPDMSPAYWGLLVAAGSIGSPGATGATGMQGPTGYAGLTGAVGQQGSAGPTGAGGAQGATGATGPAGLVGAMGAAGSTGGIGLPGTDGTNGKDGAAGLAGMVFRGAWLAGYGYTANDAVTYGNPASTYIALMNTSQSPDQSPGVWLLLAQAGSVGPSGPTGGAATVTIGSVATGAAGSEASVTNSGNSSAAVLNFTIPQGVAGALGSGGGGGGGTSGIPFASTYHAVSNSFIYFSVNNGSYSASEIGSAVALTWVPSGCSATALNVYSQQATTITVTLRAGPTPSSMVDTALACTASPGVACKAAGAVAINGGSFVDFSITGATVTPSAVWTVLTCN